MVIFHCYVSSPEGMSIYQYLLHITNWDKQIMLLVSIMLYLLSPDMEVASFERMASRHWQPAKKRIEKVKSLKERVVWLIIYLLHIKYIELVLSLYPNPTAFAGAWLFGMRHQDALWPVTHDPGNWKWMGYSYSLNETLMVTMASCPIHCLLSENKIYSNIDIINVTVLCNIEVTIHSNIVLHIAQLEATQTLHKWTSKSGLRGGWDPGISAQQRRGLKLRCAAVGIIRAWK